MLMVELSSKKHYRMTAIEKAVVAGLAVTAVLIVAAVGALVWAVVTAGIDRSEVMSCNTWKSQSTEYPGFYLLKWQKEQCDAHGIAIDATVR